MIFSMYIAVWILLALSITRLSILSTAQGEYYFIQILSEQFDSYIMTADHDLNNAGCTRGFPVLPLQNVSRVTNQPFFNRVRLIPGMNFTCNGTITRVIVAGEKRPNGNRAMKLNVWREDENGLFYKSEQEIVLSSSICDKLENFNRAFNCQLPKRMRVSVGPGDILGIEQPPQNTAIFELYSVFEPSLPNYIFRRNLPSTCIDLSSMHSVLANSMQPLIRIVIAEGIIMQL